MKQSKIDYAKQTAAAGQAPRRSVEDNLAFNMWKYANQKPVEIVPESANEIISEIVKKQFYWRPPKVGSPYSNAASILEGHPDVRYESGFVYDGANNIKHAWSSYLNIHFDLTQLAESKEAEKRATPFLPFSQYRTLVSLDHFQRHEMESVTLGIDDYHQEFWNRYVRGRTLEEIRMASAPFHMRAKVFGISSCAYPWKYQPPFWTHTASNGAASFPGSNLTGGKRD